MNLRQTVVSVGCILLGMGVGVTMLRQPSFAESQAEPSRIGRYQVSSWYDPNWSRGGFVVIDTSNGQCWKKEANTNRWVDQASPVARK